VAVYLVIFGSRENGQGANNNSEENDGAPTHKRISHVAWRNRQPSHHCHGSRPAQYGRTNLDPSCCWGFQAAACRRDVRSQSRRWKAIQEETSMRYLPCPSFRSSSFIFLLSDRQLWYAILISTPKRRLGASQLLAKRKPQLLNKREFASHITMFRVAATSTGKRLYRDERSANCTHGRIQSVFDAKKRSYVQAAGF
jgi:hypothetical protein